ncbi:MAG: hypothetical protein ABSD56_08735 [Bryobacteraceae bacterium]
MPVPGLKLRWRGRDLEMRVADPLWVASLCAVGLIYLVHITGLPILITYDGHWYIELADVLGTGRFPAEWDFLRGPIYPGLLKLAFAVFGKQPLAVAALQGALGFAGIWLLGDALRRLGRPRAAAIAVLLLGAYPTLIAYEHAVLTEAASFFFVALLVNLLVVPRWRMFARALALAGALTLAYYHRSSFLFMAPVAGAVFSLASARELKARGVRGFLCARRLAPYAALVTVLPFLLAYPWQRNPKVAARIRDSVIYGLVRQAAIAPQDPILGTAAPDYRQAIARSLDRGRLPLSGLRDGREYAIAAAAASHPESGISVFSRCMLSQPARYLSGVVRNLLLLSGLGGWESDSAAFRTAILTASGTIIMPGPPGFPAIERQFARPVRLPALGRALNRAAPLYDVLVFLGFLATGILIALGLWRMDPTLLGFTLLPAAFLGLHVLVLTSQDRMAAPVWPLFLLNLVALPAWLPMPRLTRRPDDPLLRRADQVALKAFIAILLALAACLVAYQLLSRAIPSSDEAHYMTGVYSISEALRSASPRQVVDSYVRALGFKPPLISIPAALLNVFLRDVVLASKLSGVLIFLALGLAGYSLLRNLFRPALAGFAALFLITAPVVAAGTCFA